MVAVKCIGVALKRSTDTLVMIEIGSLGGHLPHAEIGHWKLGLVGNYIDQDLLGGWTAECHLHMNCSHTDAKARKTKKIPPEYTCIESTKSRWYDSMLPKYRHLTILGSFNLAIEAGQHCYCYHQASDDLHLYRSLVSL